jgi:predicted AlkP superfamily pyrophosphatase or phosphodiesterase
MRKTNYKKDIFLRLAMTISSILLPLFFYGQTTPSKVEVQKGKQRPKLVVGIIVDQMRYDYLYKYYDKFGEGGFKKLLKDGFNCKNTNYNYTPTYTAPGHASVYTGTTPSHHGVIGNNWFVRDAKKSIYVTDDSLVRTIGSNSEKAGKMSPRNMLSSTIGDELRLYSNMKSKVIAVALKDRSAILPGGHLSNGSYWFDSESGNFITSTFYKNELPTWVRDFNGLRLADKYLLQPWNTLLPIEQYTESAPDDNPYEGLYKGETKPTFPHQLPTMFSKTDYEVLRYSPFGNSITKDIALAALKNENMGQGTATDFLAISFSSTDYVGHKFGPQSVEVEDTYLRLDKDIAEILVYLEKTYGKEGFLIFLTADHAASYVPEQMLDLKMQAGYFDSKKFADSIKGYLRENYRDTTLLDMFINEQVYLNHTEIEKAKISLSKIQNDVVSLALRFKGVSNAYTSAQLNGELLANKSASLMQAGFYIKRSGDVSLLLEPAWVDWSHTGTTHGSSYTYDTRVPLLWYGSHIKAGETYESIDITDIAPTISAMLDIMPPNSATGKPILPLLVLSK